jgi:hypothetical protein
MPLVKQMVAEGVVRTTRELRDELRKRGIKGARGGIVGLGMSVSLMKQAKAELSTE